MHASEDMAAAIDELARQRQDSIKRMKGECDKIERCVRGIELYLQMHKSLNFSPEMKVASFGEKIGLALIVMNQLAQSAIDHVCVDDTSDELQERVTSLRKRVDEAFAAVADDVLGAVAQLGSPESLLARVDKKLDTILASPDYLPGQSMMREAEHSFERDVHRNRKPA